MEPGKDKTNMVGWSAGCGESYLSGVGSAGRNSTAARQHGRRPSTPWAQRPEALVRDCIVSPDVFQHMVAIQ